jgi:hypothetical protein
MNSRWYSAAVVILWLATMSWLVVEKVLPPLLIGEPPSYDTIAKSQEQDPPTGWKISLDGRKLGWALTDAKPQPAGTMEIHGRVHFDALPIDRLIPRWLQPLSRLLVKPDEQTHMDATSALLIGSFGQLLRFDSAVQWDRSASGVSLHGVVEGRELQVSISSEGVSLSHKVSLPPNALLSDAFAPQTRLPGLRAGQTWNVPVCNPLALTENPVEIVRATVEGKEPILWNGAVENVWLVVYRGDAGNAVGANRTPKGKLWVRPDGTVLQQQMTLLDLHILFVRLPDKQAAKLVAAAGRKWWCVEADWGTKHHD